MGAAHDLRSGTTRSAGRTAVDRDAVDLLLRESEVFGNLSDEVRARVLDELELRTADPAAGLTVQKVARRWGWSDSSKFTAAYQQQYGQVPSRTLHT